MRIAPYLGRHKYFYKKHFATGAYRETNDDERYRGGGEMDNQVKDYFRMKLHNAMFSLDFQNWIIKEFLLDVLLWQLAAQGERQIFSPRKEGTVATRVLGADAHPEVLNILGKRMLFVLGLFPEHLVATGKRTVDVGYYLALERTLAKRLAPHFEPWKMIDRHFSQTIKSLNYVRLSVNIRKPKSEFFLNFQKMLKAYE